MLADAETAGLKPPERSGLADSVIDEALSAIRRASRSAGYGLYLGSGRLGPVWARPEQAVLVLGPPRSGKTTSIVIPSVLAAQGPVVSTSTKADVLLETVTARRQRGPCFVYDPSGTVELPPGAQRARWSPITRCTEWDDALLLAGRLVGAVRPAGLFGRDGASDHWTERAQALLAPLLHAAALADVEMGNVLKWVDRREASHALTILRASGREVATDQLAGVVATDAREQSGIWSTASGVVAAYRSEAALSTTVAPNFDANEFCESEATMYICATGSRQALAAPLVVGLLSEIRDTAYARSAVRERNRSRYSRYGNEGRAPVVLALDEVANIAPLPDLPAMVSEGGSQGVVTLACLQDLSQARSRWGERAEGFLSLFGTTIVLPGIGDVRTLEAMSTLAGEHEIPTRSVSSPVATGGRGLVSAVATRLALGSRARARDKTPTVTSSSTYRRRLPPDVVAHGQEGHALMVDESNRMSWLKLTRSYENWPWREATGAPSAHRHEVLLRPEPLRGPESGRAPRPPELEGPGSSLG